MNEKEHQPSYDESKSDKEPSATTIQLAMEDDDNNNNHNDHIQQHQLRQQQVEEPEADTELDIDTENDQQATTTTGGTVNNSSGVNTTDDEILLEDGLPASIPLSSLAGPALVMSPDMMVFSGEEENAGTMDEGKAGPRKKDLFDWAGRDEEEEEGENKKGKNISQSSLFICLSKNSSYIAWTCVILFALILIAVDVAIFVIYRGPEADQDAVSMVPYNLKMWFTFLAFMWCIGFLSQVAVELVPWAIKKLFGYLRPQSTEVLRMRLSYFMALRSFIKLIIIAAWAWGSWAFLAAHIPLPRDPNAQDNNTFQEKPSYIGVFYSIWECIFFASILLFVEKFFLQLIVTSFHKKAYGSRIEDNDKALKVLDKLKKVKRKTPQEFLLGKIRRKAKNMTSRSQSMDENNTTTTTTNNNNKKSQQPASIMNTTTTTDDTAASPPPPINNVRFPSQNVDTLIAIPPLERDDDEKYQQDHADDEHPPAAAAAAATLSDDATTIASPPKYRFAHQLTKKIRSNNNRRKSSHDSSHRPSLDHPHQSRFTGSMDEYRSSIDQPAQSRKNSNHSSSSRQQQQRPRMISRDTNTTFLNSTSAIPGKLLKDGYRKIKSKSNHVSASAMTNQSTSQQAKSLAKRIYHNLMGPEPARDYMVEADLYPYFRTQEAAAAAFRLFDVDGNGDISKRELRSGCIRIYRERKNLARSMRDLSQATGKMDIILLVIFTAIWVIIVCAAFGVNVGTELMPLWSAFIAASFVFGNSAKEAFDSIIFVFVTHPFDAGDRVFIGTDNFTVDNVGLLVTTFLKWDGSVVYVKNAILSTLYIINVRRTGPMGETVPLNVDFNTPTWKLHQLREHMFEFCNQFPKLFVPNCVCATVVSFENQNKINLSYYFCHTENWQDPTGRMIRHNNFMLELKDECCRLGIAYAMPPQPFSEGHEVNERHHPLDQAHLHSNRERSEGLHQRRPYQEEEYEDDARTGGGNAGGTNGGAGSQSGGAGDSGAAAGAAATMMFSSMM